MPNVNNPGTAEAIARAFTSNGRNEEQGLLTVGYSKQYARGGQGNLVYSNVLVKAAIARIDRETGGKRDHDRAVSIELLRQNLALLSERANKGDIQAIQARTAVIRELNAISNLHSSTVHDKSSTDKALPPAEAAVIAELAEDYKRKLMIRLSKGDRATAGP